MVNAHLGCGFHSSPQATNHLCQGLNSTPLYWGCDKLIPPLINRESLFHGYIKHPYGLGLMSGNLILGNVMGVDRPNPTIFFLNVFPDEDHLLW